MPSTPYSPSAGARRRPRVRWRAIFAGLVLAIATTLVLGVAHAFPWSKPALEPAHTGSGSRAAVYVLIALCVGVLAALLGGAAGSAGLRGGRRLFSRDPQDEYERLHERDREAREQDEARRDLKRR